jgi:hypothetical protein
MSFSLQAQTRPWSPPPWDLKTQSTELSLSGKASIFIYLFIYVFVCLVGFLRQHPYFLKTEVKPHGGKFTYIVLYRHLVEPREFTEISVCFLSKVLTDAEK